MLPENQHISDSGKKLAKGESFFLIKTCESSCLQASSIPLGFHLPALAIQQATVPPEAAKQMSGENSILLQTQYNDVSWTPKNPPDIGAITTSDI
jgi:hypothetical protein